MKDKNNKKKENTMVDSDESSEEFNTDDEDNFSSDNSDDEGFDIEKISSCYTESNRQIIQKLKKDENGNKSVNFVKNQDKDYTKFAYYPITYYKNNKKSTKDKSKILNKFSSLNYKLLRELNQFKIELKRENESKTTTSKNENVNKDSLNKSIDNLKITVSNINDMINQFQNIIDTNSTLVENFEQINQYIVNSNTKGNIIK
jgi:hypothetical protein